MLNNIDRAHLLKALALVVLEVYSLDDAAAALRLEPCQVAAALASDGMQAKVDAEILRLRFSGRLADLKLMVATERFADRLLDADTSAMSPATAAKVAESIIKARQSIPRRPTEEEERAKEQEVQDHLRFLFMRTMRHGASHDICE